jgi:hypothetical protein
MIRLVCLLLAVLAAPPAAFAADQPSKQDNSGTNPVNFTYDFRLITEMASLPDGNNSLITNTFELRWPLGRDVAYLGGSATKSPYHGLGTKVGARVRLRYADLNLDTAGPASFGVSGIGDFDARLLFLPYVSPGFILAAGLEAFFNTATNAALGSGKTSLGPQIFGVFPGLLGKTSLFAPAYQYVFDIAGPSDRADISRSQIDLYFVWALAAGRNWLIVDPQIVFDHENDKTPVLAEIEWGFMIAPSSGVSGYLRPGAGIGADRPYDWNVEAGLKLIWR